MKNIITLSDAKKKGLGIYFTGKPCVSGHISDRNTKRGLCIACMNIQSDAKKSLTAEKRQAIKSKKESDRLLRKHERSRLSKEAAKLYGARYRSLNRPYFNSYNEQYKRLNKVDLAAKDRAYYDKNRGLIKAKRDLKKSNSNQENYNKAQSITK